MMKRPITIASGQFGDLPFEELCRVISGMGYDGIEVAVHAHLNAKQAAEDREYRRRFLETLAQYGLKVWAISAHLAGQCVGDQWDPRLDNFAPDRLKGQPEAIRQWAVEEVKNAVRAAAALGVRVVTCFLGSPIWPYWYSFPQTPPSMVEEGYQKIKELWTPIFDLCDEYGVKLALEIHPTEIAFDYYSTKKLMDVLEWRPTLGINFDPSHLKWQGVDPAVFLRDFSSRIYHVHMKDVKMNLDGRNGILGSHIEFGDTHRGWNFVSLGHGDVDFDAIIRELNQMQYTGPLSVEWEDSGMERMAGAAEALEFVRRMNFAPSDICFDSALKSS